MLPDHHPESAFPETFVMKDLTYARKQAAVTDIAAAGVELMRGLFDEAVESGLGECYHPVIATLIDREQST